jgi:hypothetical protein
LTTPVVVERHYPFPVTLRRIRAADAKGQWCIAANGNHAIFHALSADGQRSICVYTAPDAEAVRRVADVLAPQMPVGIWPSTEHWAPYDAPRTSLATSEEGATVALVDRHFDAPIDYREAQALEDEQSHCLTLHRVRFLRSYQSLDRTRMLCLYAGPDLEAVRSANRLTGLPVTEVMAVMVRDPA